MNPARSIPPKADPNLSALNERYGILIDRLTGLTSRVKTVEDNLCGERGPDKTSAGLAPVMNGTINILSGKANAIEALLNDLNNSIERIESHI